MDYKPQGDDGEGEALAAAGEAEAMQEICEHKADDLFNALKATREEPGVSIHQIAVSIRGTLDTAEVAQLIKELTD